MRRDVGNEVVVAVLVVATLSFALVFAILLATSSNNSEITPTEVAVISNAVDDTPDAMNSLSESTEVVDLETPTSESAVVTVNTDEPTETPTSTATNTDEATETATATDEPTEAPTSTPTNTDEPTQAPTSTATNTDEPTEVPTSTATHTDEPTETATATDTDEPTEVPTETSTATFTPTYTETSTATDTPTATQTNTATSTPTHTATATLTYTPSITPTNTPVPTATSGIVPTPTVKADVEIIGEDECVVEPDWLTYEIQSGDNLLFISRAVSSTISEIRFGNCYDLIRGIFVGENILLPTLPDLPIATIEPVFPSDDMELVATGCKVDDTQVSIPQSLDSIQGIFAVIGTATSTDFAYYKIEIRPEWSDVYILYLESLDSVKDDLLGLVNTELFGSGLHRLRITVVNDDGEIAENGVCEIPLVFIAPS